jgi:hypothetical protein
MSNRRCLFRPPSFRLRLFVPFAFSFRGFNRNAPPFLGGQVRGSRLASERVSQSRPAPRFSDCDNRSLDQELKGKPSPLQSARRALSSLRPVLIQEGLTKPRFGLANANLPGAVHAGRCPWPTLFNRNRQFPAAFNLTHPRPRSIIRIGFGEPAAQRFIPATFSLFAWTIGSFQGNSRYPDNLIEWAAK